MDKKSPLLSKTLWTNAIIAVVALVSPSVSEWIQGHPAESAVFFSIINMCLRLVTKKEISVV